MHEFEFFSIVAGELTARPGRAAGGGGDGVGCFNGELNVAGEGGLNFVMRSLNVGCWKGKSALNVRIDEREEVLMIDGGRENQVAQPSFYHFLSLKLFVISSCMRTRFN